MNGFLSGIKPSIKFWNLVAIIIYYSTYFLGPWFILTTIAVSIIGFILIVDDNHDDHYWLMLTPLFLALLIGIGIIEGFIWLYKRSIVPFNCWLDKCNAKPKEQTLDEAINQVNEAYKNRKND